MWATETAAGATNVVLINSGTTERTIGVRVQRPSGPAAISYLQAPSLSSRSVSLGGESFGGSTSTGLLSTNAHARPVVIRAVHGIYAVRLPGPSVALLTFSR